VLRKKLTVLLVAAMMVMAASPAWAAPGGNGQGLGQGVGGGDISNVDQGAKTRTGGGPLNNPNVGGCDVACE
jgi:hypothetical protein